MAAHAGTIQEGRHDVNKILPLVFAAIAVEHNTMDRGRELFDFAPRAIGMTQKLHDQLEAEIETEQLIINPFRSTGSEKLSIMGLPVMIVPGSGRKLWMMREIQLFLDDQEGDE